MSQTSRERVQQLKAEFAAYRGKWSEVAREYEKTAPEGSLIESAVPSYAHKNRAIAWLFWRRIQLAAQYLAKQENVGRTLDFGCGVGVSLPLILDFAEHADVHGADLKIQPAKDLSDRMGFGEAHLHGGFDEAVAAAEGPFDTIVALDVLEHFADLPERLEQIKQAMAPGGLLLVCGPTENWIYKMGRLLAGFRALYKSQDEVEHEHEDLNPYHHFTIYQIQKLMEQAGFDVEVVKTLFPVVPLFRVIAGRLPS
jgi:SAM-dependent methyltransferase